MQVAQSLLALDLQSRKKKVQVARWQTLTAFAQSSCASTHGSTSLFQQLTSRTSWLAVLQRAYDERFSAKDVVVALTQCVVVLALQSDPAHVDVLALTLADAGTNATSSSDNGDDDERDSSFSLLALVKQLYVTLDDFALRQALVDALLRIIASKEHVKAVVRVGLLRSLLQVALDNSASGSHSAAHTLDPSHSTSDDADGDAEPSDESRLSDDLMLQCAKVLTHVAAFVCYASPVDASAAADVSDRCSEQFVCELVVALVLSGVSVVFQDGVRLLQMLLECPEPRLQTMLVAVVDLRGALEKAQALAEQHASGQRVLDPYVATLAQQQSALLTPTIDAYERALGASLVGLPADPVGRHDSLRTSSDSNDDDGLETALALATQCKERGNRFFKRGNFPTARAFYRRAIALLRMAQRVREHALATLSPAHVLAQCSAGASVQVLSRCRRNWRNAMVSDVDSGRVEVIYDDDDDVEDDDDECVEPSRVRLRMPTRVLEAFDALEVDCAMNMGKAFVQLGDHARAVESFAHALRVTNHTHVAALYHRGVAHMALHDLQSAQQDLWRANDLARKRGDHTLRKQVVAAYKRLQALHKHKKRMDKKLVKQMMSYLATIPAIQDEQL